MCVCSSPPSCINGNLVLTREAPSCNINGYLVITGEANIKLLSKSANGCGPGGTSGAHTITLSIVQPICRALALPQVDLPALALSTWVVTPVFHWVGMTAKRQLETLLLLLPLCVCVRMHARGVCVHATFFCMQSGPTLYKLRLCSKAEFRLVQ